MPSLSPTMSMGNITAWKVAEGGEIAAGDVIAEVETDKATMDWEAQDEGYMAKILVAEGTKDIPLGTLVAIVVDEKDQVAAFKDYSEDGELSSAPVEEAAPAEEEAAKPSSGAGSFPPHTILGMPALSPTMSHGNIATWKVKVGDAVAAGDSVAEVETDKATMDWEAQEDGFVAAILVPDGAKDLEINSPCAVMVEEESDIAAFKNFTAADAGASGAVTEEAPAAAEAPKSPEQQQAPVAEAKQQVAAPQSSGRVAASPYARKLASEAGVDVSLATGTGPNGRIVAADVQQLIASGAANETESPRAAAPVAAKTAPVSIGGFRDVPNSNIRKITAQRLLESKQTVPHYYLTVDTRVDKLLALRSQINESLAATGEGKLSVNDFIIKASALALRKVPDVNASWLGEFIRYYDTVDISIAVQTPNGLMVPILRNADMLGLLEINAGVRSLATKAKEGKLKPDEFTGGSFTISNLGMYGVDQFAAIINPPQAAILAVGTTSSRVVVGADGSFEAASILKATLSADHRVVDGALGAQWLQAFRGYIEDPLTMLV